MYITIYFILMACTLITLCTSLLQAKEHIVVIFKKEVSKGDVFVHLYRNNFQKKIKCTELNALTYTFKPEGKIF